MKKLLAMKYVAIILTSLILIVNFQAKGQGKVDSSKRYDLIITPRLNSTGHFPFTGYLVNTHLNFDLNIFYQRKTYGFFVFKSHDLVQSHSIINYLQPGVFKHFPVTSSLTLGLYFGYVFSQASSFNDAGSDYYSAFTAHWNVAKGIRVENTFLIYDMINQEKISNRLLILISLKKFRMDFYVWQRHVPLTNAYSTSISLGLNSPKFQIFKSTTTRATLSYQRYMTENKPDFALKDGFLFSLAFPINLSR